MLHNKTEQAQLESERHRTTREHVDLFSLRTARVNVRNCNAITNQHCWRAPACLSGRSDIRSLFQTSCHSSRFGLVPCKGARASAVRGYRDIEIYKIRETEE